tara:strand:- start:1343 stop:2221 length:879 start_codon:yes stop_codon:yes gene_type:complete
MSFIVAASALVSTGLGVYQAIQGQEAAGIAAEEARKAREELMAQRERFAELDTSNPFLGLQNMYDGMDNKMDGLRVNTEQAEFEKQQAMQGQANILGQLRQGAGASGIAALAQSLANEGSLQAQRSSASIGAQEAKNQQLEASEASRIQDLQLGEDSRIQGLERKGDLMSRNMQFGMLQSQMGMTAGDVSNANANLNTANQQMWSGIGMAAGGVGDFAVQAGTWDFGRGDKTTDVTNTNQPQSLSDMKDASGYSHLTDAQYMELVRKMGGDASGGNASGGGINLGGDGTFIS